MKGKVNVTQFHLNMVILGQDQGGFQFGDRTRGVSVEV